MTVGLAVIYVKLLETRCPRRCNILLPSRPPREFNAYKVIQWIDNRRALYLTFNAIRRMFFRDEYTNRKKTTFVLI